LVAQQHVQTRDLMPPVRTDSHDAAALIRYYESL